MGRATLIITLIISTNKRLLSKLGWGRGSKTAKTRLSASDATNSSVHLTHLIKKMVKTTTKINTHELKLIHNGSESDPYSRKRRWNRWGRGLRAKDSVLMAWKIASSCWAWADSSWGRLALVASYASLLLINSQLTAPMIEKREVEGIRMCMCVRMHLTAEVKISLSRVAMSW